MRVLVTGATGKVGRALIRRILRDGALSGWQVRTLTHSRRPEDRPRPTTRIIHVVHLATCSRAKAELGWRLSYDLEALIESAWSYRRPANEPRKVWYAG